MTDAPKPAPATQQAREVSDAMVLAALQVQYPATYGQYLRHPACGPNTSIRTEAEIDTARRMIAAALAATPHPSPTAQAAESVMAPSETTPNPACKPDMLVNGGALILALNVLRRAGKHEVAGELEATAQPAPTAQADSRPTPVGELDDDACRCEPSDYVRPADYDGDGSVAAMARRAARAPAESVTAPAGGGAVVEWHAPGLGEVHNESHGQLIFCTDGDDVADDTLARRVCAALNATPPAQAADSVLEDAARLTTEQEYAIRQGHEIAASEAYFGARSKLDTNRNHNIFTAGFERGWDAARKQGANHDNT